MKKQSAMIYFFTLTVAKKQQEMNPSLPKLRQPQRQMLELFYSCLSFILQHMDIEQSHTQGNK